ncbi:MAG: sulfite exporter TauE/SafE family protein [Treponema sp.]|jgi:sulfite exporter TauE/SafE/copper chaperone CopZ/plastocyanin domain-containing protein|nr:sulfite exporter TauE/SafE family protein [Treponema sp.]
MDTLKSSSFHIDGMTCINCQNRIEGALKSTLGVEDAAVNFSTGAASVTYNPSILAFAEIKAVIENLGYQVPAGGRQTGAGLAEITGTLVIIFALYMLLRGLGLNTLAAAFPLAERGMGYGMLFVTGLITSLHCAAMCGGINLSQCIPAAAPEGPSPPEGFRKVLLPSVLYNAGRVISYTAIGIFAGALGSAITLPGRFQGAVQIIAGAFMVIMGINMLGFFPFLRRFNPRMPAKVHAALSLFFTKKGGDKKGRSKSPLFIGLLNGFMPCGPLQAMQLYALASGSPAAGGISMFLFSMGTVPLIFGIGALSSVLSRKFTRRIMRAGAILVTVMGITMFTYGFNLGGFSNPLPFASRPDRAGEAAFTPVIEQGIQIVNSALSPGAYPPITVQQGIPVRWTINASPESINGCNSRMSIREYGIEYRFQPGENVIEFTPQRAGKFSYSCWMGMIRSSITVVAEGEIPQETEPALAPVPAGVTIPADTLALAEIQGGRYQQVRINLRDEGFEPAVIVVQKDIEARWYINNDSLDPGNSRLIFPAYYTQTDMEQGDNEIYFMPLDDFEFSTGDNVFYGYVKVVEDLNNADAGAIKKEVSEFETLIYPDAYFELAAQSAGCCR